jgi:hypothetical protein
MLVIKLLVEAGAIQTDVETVKIVQLCPLSPCGRGLGRGVACYTKKFIQIPYLLISYEQSSY